MAMCEGPVDAAADGWRNLGQMIFISDPPASIGDNPNKFFAQRTIEIRSWEARQMRDE